MRSEEQWKVLGDLRRGGIDGELVLKQEDLARIPVAELRRALASQADFYGRNSAEAKISSAPEAYFDEEDGPFELMQFEWEKGVLELEVTLISVWPEHETEEAVLNGVGQLLTPYLEERRVKPRHIGINDWYCYGQELAITVRLGASWRGQTIQQVVDLGRGVLKLCEAYSDRKILRETVGALVRGGGAELLVGQPEGNWLDAKSQEYDLNTTHGEISLAQAVAKFCNAEDGGLIVVGADAKKVPGGEVIRRIRGVNASPGVAARYQRVLDRRLYPPPLCMRIDVVPVAEERALIVIDVPAQGEELKPFLVHGAIRSDGQVEGSFISIVQRRGEASIPITAPMIHATLAAGRALLRGQGKSEAANPEAGM